MNKKTRRIIVISGVTGAIGSALLAEYAKSSNNIVYGISRKALPVKSFLRKGKLPHKTLICSVGESLDYESLFKYINYCVEEVIYIHALGLYPFEVNSRGNIVVENDRDMDDINDEVTKLTFNGFTTATQSLQKYWSGKSKCVIFGGIADKHKPLVHQSWWKTIEKVKGYMKAEVKKNKSLSMIVFNISSVLCPHEIITRPFVFTHTDADQAYWLSPYELSRFVVNEVSKKEKGFYELEKFKIKPNFSLNTYYKDKQFKPRKIKELYKK